jgi:3-keto-disaccharide hydrolase
MELGEWPVPGSLKAADKIDNQTRPGGSAQGASVLWKAGEDVLWFVLTSVVCFVLTNGVIHMLHSPDRGLPYRDHFVSSDNTEWSAYGGNWRVQSGIMVNESNERGAKLVTGSAYWQDYTIQADVALRSLGDAGLIARVSDPEQGVDSYSGIYAGLRVRDEALVLGIADHDWQETVAKPLSSSIVPKSWYHLRVQLNGCKVNAVVNGEDLTELARVDVTLGSCPLRGKIGLRSYESGGMWKNVEVTKLIPSS